MKVFGANISLQVSDFLTDSLRGIKCHEEANQKIYGGFGILHFFENDGELETLKKELSVVHTCVAEPDRAEYGDFQTNSALADMVALHLSAKGVSPKVVIEPTCGKGSFIIAALRNFKDVRNVFGIEIYRPYVWEAKFNVLEFLLSDPDNSRPDISIVHCNVFDFNFKAIAEEHAKEEVLVIGNPPWVTNSKLGSLNSTNLPRKTNFKNHSGLDAMTGKGNFDIAEFIAMTMIETFQGLKGNLMLLVKNSVIKNIVFDQHKNRYRISDIEKHCIDSKKEFDVSVEAALFSCALNSPPALDCTEFDFYNNRTAQLRFGWKDNKFVSNIDAYILTEGLDGECPFVWRQGVKHDCSSVMELDRVSTCPHMGGGRYVNGLNEEVELEEGLVHGILKSSDLKNTVIGQTRKFTIVTQRKVGQSTGYIRAEYPLTHQYLIAHQANFDARKSSIYNNKPMFSIFGIGDYSFKPYKVAISGLYKTFHFTLVLPQDNKPVMLDDTCYMIGFDKMEFAVYALILLNSERTVQFLRSVTFPDAKRTFTKDVLMRIDLLALAKQMDR